MNLSDFFALRLWVGWQDGHLPCKTTEMWGAGMVICLGEVQICIWPSWCHCHSVSCSSKSRIATFLVLAYTNRLLYWRFLRDALYKSTFYLLTYLLAYPGSGNGPLNGCSNLL